MTTAAGRAATVPLRSSLLGAGCVVWATAPLIHTGYLYLALLLASLGVIAGALRLALASIPVPEDTYGLTAAVQFWLRFSTVVRLVPWEEGTLIAVLWLEVLHPARPWHTAVLGGALIAYLLATHLAESGASAGVLRPQARVLAAGAGLLALGAGAGMVPAAGPGGAGSGSALLRLVAAGALVAAAVLVLPNVARGEAPDPGPHPEQKPDLPGRPARVRKPGRRGGRLAPTEDRPVPTLPPRSSG